MSVCRERKREREREKERKNEIGRKVGGRERERVDGEEDRRKE